MEEFLTGTLSTAAPAGPGLSKADSRARLLPMHQRFDIGIEKHSPAEKKRAKSEQMSGCKKTGHETKEMTLKNHLAPLRVSNNEEV